MVWVVVAQNVVAIGTLAGWATPVGPKHHCGTLKVPVKSLIRARGGSLLLVVAVCCPDGGGYGDGQMDESLAVVYHFEQTLVSHCLSFRQGCDRLGPVAHFETYCARQRP